MTVTWSVELWGGDAAPMAALALVEAQHEGRGADIDRLMDAWEEAGLTWALAGALGELVHAAIYTAGAHNGNVGRFLLDQTRASSESLAMAVLLGQIESPGQAEPSPWATCHVCGLDVQLDEQGALSEHPSLWPNSSEQCEGAGDEPCWIAGTGGPAR